MSTLGGAGRTHIYTKSSRSKNYGEVDNGNHEDDVTGEQKDLLSRVKTRKGQRRRFLQRRKKGYVDR